jgi:ATP-dependent DNA ligase
LEDEHGRTLARESLSERRRRLEALAARYWSGVDALRLSPVGDRRAAESWFAARGHDLDGVMAKRADAPYFAGERQGMVKVKHVRTADCVVGGFRYGKNSRVAASLLLGLYDEAGALHYVGFAAGFSHAERAELTRILEPLRGPPSFTAGGPGAPSRWSSAERSTVWEALRPELVVEVLYDHLTGGRFRHGTRLVRFRPDKAPAQCTMAQLENDETVAPPKERHRLADTTSSSDQPSPQN